MIHPRALRMEAEIEEIPSEARYRIYCRETSALIRMSWKGMPLRFGETSNYFTYLYELFGEKDGKRISTNIYHYSNKNTDSSATVVWNMPAGIGLLWHEFLVGFQPGDSKSRNETISKLKEIIKNVEWSERT